MDKFLKIVIGWVAILLLMYLILFIVSLVFPIQSGDEIQLIVISGFVFIAFMLWYFKVDIDEKLEKLLEQKSKIVQ